MRERERRLAPPRHWTPRDKRRADRHAVREVMRAVRDEVEHAPARAELARGPTSRAASDRPTPTTRKMRARRRATCPTSPSPTRAGPPRFRARLLARDGDGEAWARANARSRLLSRRESERGDAATRGDRRGILRRLGVILVGLVSPPSRRGSTASDASLPLRRDRDIVGVVVHPGGAVRADEAFDEVKRERTGHGGEAHSLRTRIVEANAETGSRPSYTSRASDDAAAAYACGSW